MRVDREGAEFTGNEHIHSHTDTELCTDSFFLYEFRYCIITVFATFDVNDDEERQCNKRNINTADRHRER